MGGLSSALVEKYDRALDHLRDVLYVLRDLDPEDHWLGLDEAIAFYNAARPTERVEPSGSAPVRIIRDKTF